MYFLRVEALGKSGADGHYYHLGCLFQSWRPALRWLRESRDLGLRWRVSDADLRDYGRGNYVRLVAPGYAPAGKPWHAGRRWPILRVVCASGAHVYGPPLHLNTCRKCGARRES